LNGDGLVSLGELQEFVARTAAQYVARAGSGLQSPKSTQRTPSGHSTGQLTGRSIATTPLHTGRHVTPPTSSVRSMTGRSFTFGNVALPWSAGEGQRVLPCIDTEMVSAVARGYMDSSRASDATEDEHHLAVAFSKTELALALAKVGVILSGTELDTIYSYYAARTAMAAVKESLPTPTRLKDAASVVEKTLRDRDLLLSEDEIAAVMGSRAVEPQAVLDYADFVDEIVTVHLRMSNVKVSAAITEDEVSFSWLSWLFFEKCRRLMEVYFVCLGQ
jgi:hypothetical protein